MQTCLPISVRLHCRRFIQYIHPLGPDEINQLDDDMKADKWRLESMIDMKNSFERLHIFQFF